LTEFDLAIRLFEERDIPEIAAAFAELGWHKPASLYQRYLMEQSMQLCDMHVAFVREQFAGYLLIYWISGYKPFREKRIPEIVDFNVLPEFRRKGIGSRLMDKAEYEIVKISPIAGIGVGMTPDYGAAQRLYVLRGYIPDGLGLHWRDHYVQFGETVRMDDDLALYLTKELK
jgi:GNAT superfamily N-acetyltransferase